MVIEFFLYRFLAWFIKLISGDFNIQFTCPCQGGKKLNCSAVVYNTART